MKKTEPFWKIFGIVLLCAILGASFLMGFVWFLTTITYAFGFWYAVAFMVVVWSFLIAVMVYITQLGMLEEKNK